MKIFQEKKEEAEKELVNPNIILCGKTGVGKSTLINSIFRERLADTATGQPVTKGLNKYQKEDVPITLYDTKGLELENESRDEVKKEITETIQNKNKSDQASDHMHIMWYCISNEADRLEEAEEEWLNHFSKQMKVIIVLTKTYSTNEEFLAYLKKKEFPVLDIIQVLADDKELKGGLKVPKHGLIDLVKRTHECLPEAVKHAFANAQAVDIETKEKEAKRYLYSYVSIRAGVGGAFAPGLDSLAVWGNHIYMISKINTIFGLPNEKGFSKSLLKGLTGSSLAASGPKGVKAVSETLLKKYGKAGLAQLFKNSNVIFKGFSAVTSVVSTLLLGNSYIKVCAEIVSKEEIEQLSAEEISDLLQQAFKEEVKNKEEKGFEDETL